MGLLVNGLLMIARLHSLIKEYTGVFFISEYLLSTNIGGIYIENLNCRGF